MKKNCIKKNTLAISYATFVFVAGLFAVALITYEDITKLTAPFSFSLSDAWENIDTIPAIKPTENLPVPGIIPKKRADAQVLNLPTAAAAAIVDVSSGEILYEKMSTQKRAIASITKLFTAMVVIDNIEDLRTKITIPQEVFLIEGTRVGCSTSTLCEGERLRTGDKVAARSLLQAMLIASANDAATALAIHIGGSEEGFSQIMNAKARELNLVNSNFCRPSGLERDNAQAELACYSSARDLGILMATLVKDEKYQEIEEILQMTSATFTGEDATIRHNVSSTNKLLTKDFGFEVIGKTGFTLRAGPSLIMMGRQSALRQDVVAVVLDDPDRFEDITKMLTWAFANHSWYDQ